MNYCSFKIRLELNNKQVTLAKKHAGVARHAYNWGLAICKKAYQNQEKHPSAIDLHKKLVREVKSVYTWYYEVSKCAPQEALRNLTKAYQRFFKKQAKHPVFQKKGRKDSFYLEGKIQAKNSKIKLPRFGWVRLAENVNFEGIKNATISRKAHHWFVSFRVPRENYKIKTIENKEVIGVDLGIKNLATLSDGTIFPNLRPYKKYKRKLKIEQRKLSKKFKKGQPQSNNYKKQQLKVSKIHYKIACTRQDTLHKLTTYLAKNHSQITLKACN